MQNNRAASKKKRVQHVRLAKNNYMPTPFFGYIYDGHFLLINFQDGVNVKQNTLSVWTFGANGV